VDERPVPDDEGFPGAVVRVEACVDERRIGGILPGSPGTGGGFQGSLERRGGSFSAIRFFGRTATEPRYDFRGGRLIKGPPQSFVTKCETYVRIVIGAEWRPAAWGTDGPRTACCRYAETVIRCAFLKKGR
jgi:hypothetical protein